ncbi:amino acid adenylation domain-containing protein [Fontibacillus panacisegetis]|uniref:Amino acid adenylation domain-containing protein n=1 Tax=Fontibacillus panacisegetis TaxID=670482 RepID=A0A1G7QQT6_9BACL|nr:non-ribosomal peptide synthetase [Fontibacillus panacisegetis]SDG00906.1 amino acid adenylation domain-containing protein [Fontibacillus panacisegetis]
MNLDLLSGELEEYREAREFWMKMLSDAEEVEVLAPDRPVGVQNRDSFYEQRLSLSFTASLAEGLMKWSSEKDSLLYVILLSGIMTALVKLRSNPSVIVGCPTVDGTNWSEPAVNRVLPIYLNIEGSQTVKQLWKELNRTIAAAYGYQFYPIDHVGSEQGLKAAHLCNVACELDPMHDPSILQTCRQSAINGATFSFKKSDQKIWGELIYNADLYSASMMQSLAGSFMHVLDQMVDNPDLQVRNLSLVNNIGIHQLLKEFHPNKGEFPANESVAQLFEEQVHLTPDRTALVCGEKRLSYSELNERADCFAAQLAELGIRRGQVIGIVFDRTPDAVTAMLAVLKAGAAYLPIDPAYPQARINYMLEDSGAAGLITPSKYAGHISYNGCILLIQQNGLEALSSGSETFIDQLAPLHCTEKENTAYVIYTSGSTGMPKGVMVGHQGMANLHTFFRNELGIRESDKIIQFASASFDASIWEMFMAFFTGAELHLIEKETIESYESFTDYVRRSGITVATLPPTYASHLDPCRVSTLRMLVTAGSASDPELAKRWGQHMKYINAYGPTESTVCATFWQTDHLSLSEIDTMRDYLTSVPIGKPILNTEIYIVNREDHLLPVGFMGELCIGGVSLALGYLGREQLTAERFVENPFVPGEVMYKTGDYAKWLPDGNIDFLGRIDHQVKIRGFRIEIGEIEVQLVQHPDISEAHVTAKRDIDGEACLCAYFSPWKGNRTDELKGWLAERLPAFMLPQYYFPLEKLPLTANGKIDTKALPDPAAHDPGGMDAADDPSATATERKLADLWKLTLGKDRASLDDHFFNCGGHSLKAATLITEIHKHFQIQLTLRMLMEAPTLRGMAGAIDLSLESGSLPAIEPAQPRDYYPLSLAQKRMFILNQYEPKQLTYNIPVALRIDGPVDKEKLQKALHELVQRHETLRTSFMLHEGHPVQQIHTETQLRLGYRTIQEYEPGDELQRFTQPFDLAKAPLLRAELLHINANRHVLCLDMHHIISDGVSMSVLIDDMMRLYQNEALEPLRLQYKDFSCWQNEMLDTGRLSEQEAFWLNEFATPAPQLQIQTDYLRQTSSEEEGADEAVKIVLPPEIASGLHTLAASTGSTLYMVLLSAYSVLLSIYSGQTDIVVGTPVAGRSRADLQPLIGMFVNILPIRSKPEYHKTFLEYLAEVKETSLSALEHQDFPFDELVRRLNIARDAGRNPLFDASFALQNMDTDIPAIDGLNMEPVDLNFYQAKFDLTLWAEEKGAEILLALEYRTRLFKRQTAEKLLRDMNRLIGKIIESPHMQVGAIDLRTSEEIKEQERRFIELEAALEIDFEL